MAFHLVTPKSLEKCWKNVKCAANEINNQSESGCMMNLEEQEQERKKN